MNLAHYAKLNKPDKRKANTLYGMWNKQFQFYRKEIRKMIVRYWGEQERGRCKSKDYTQTFIYKKNKHWAANVWHSDHGYNTLSYLWG